MYETFRGTSDDITAIANNTGWSIEDVTTVKNHVFNDIVLKDDGVYGTLDSYYEQALAWQRLIDGNYYQSDILLLEHELSKQLTTIISILLIIAHCVKHMTLQPIIMIGIVLSQRY